MSVHVKDFVKILCNVINDGIIGNDTIRFIKGMKDPYIFSLLPCILVYKVHNFELCRDHVSAYLTFTPRLS